MPNKSEENIPTLSVREEILEELVSKVTDYGYNNEYGYYNEWADGVKPILEKALTLLEQETIKAERERLRGMILKADLITITKQDILNLLEK